MNKNCTIICVDIKSGGDETPVIVQNYGLMTKEQAEKKLMSIYNSEKKYLKDMGLDKSTILEWTNTYVGVCFDMNYIEDLDRREYYLIEMEEK